MTHNGRPIRIQRIPFPVKTCGGATIRRPAEYLVLVNESVTPIQQRHALGHELAHIYLGHLEKVAGLAADSAGIVEDDALEREANRHAWAFYRAYKDGDLQAGRIPATAEKTV